MDDLKALNDVVLERIETLAKVRLEKLNWGEANKLTQSELVRLPGRGQGRTGLSRDVARW
jgi:hypothetical protein